MKMMKKYLVWLCIVAIAVSAMSFSVFADEAVRYEAEDAVYQESGMSSSGGALVGFKDNPQAFATFTVPASQDGEQTVKVN